MTRFFNILQAWWRAPRRVWRRSFPGRLVSIEVQQGGVFLLLAGLLVWYLAAPSETIAFLLATVAGMVGVAYIWARRLASGLHSRRILQSVAMQVGDELEEQVYLTNQSVFPALWVEFMDRSNLPGYTLSGVRGVGGGGSLSWRAHTICSRRGVFILGPWEVRTGDPFGLFLVRHQMLDRQEILVYPPLAVLPETLVPRRGKLGDHRPLRLPLQADTVDGISVREYTYGDSLRRIHWPTTARKEAPYVKVFEPESVSRIWILPDLDPEAQLGEGEDSTEETIILLAASLAARLLRDRFHVGVFLGGEEPVAALPDRGLSTLWKLLELLAPCHPVAGNNLSRQLAQLRPLLSPRDMVLIVTAAMDEGWVQSLQRLIPFYDRGGAWVLLLDPHSFGGKLQAEDFRMVLANLGVESQIVRRGEIRSMPGVYGELSRWEFMTLGTGRAIARQTPRRAAALFASRDGLR
ncbi:DUF58 domain-containing protein [Anaerolinea thermolimosa]|uniref:DUF58 domain-containing protein n=1 Tax=Anaerolinea thermolimosa TaxID=229919 RepID=UPI000A058628|nr:DUF58 domain-containing protein [Anaerolinea thermolimosa]